MTEQEAIGKRIRDMRQQRGWTLEQLAHESGLTTSYCGEVERGTRNASIGTVASIARALGTTLADVVAGRRLQLNGDLEALLEDIPESLRESALETLRETLRLSNRLAENLARRRRSSR